jgi:putative Holliday junction resolvase
MFFHPGKSLFVPQQSPTNTPFADLPAFAEVLPQHGAIFGLDPGTKTIGVATSDVTRSVATAIKTIRRRKFANDSAELLALASEREAVGFIIGLPINLNGTEGPRAQSVRAFARNLAALTPLPIAFWDERLSTVAAERVLLAADTSRKRRAEVIDAVAAAYILQGALDRLRQLS